MKILSTLILGIFFSFPCIVLNAEEPLAFVIDDAGAILPIYNQEHLAIFQDTCPRRTYVNNQTHFFYSEEAYSRGYPITGQLCAADFSPYPMQGLPDYNKRCFEADYYTPRPYQAKNEWSTVSKWVGALVFCYAVIKWKIVGESKEERDAKRKKAALDALYEQEKQRILQEELSKKPASFIIHFKADTIEVEMCKPQLPIQQKRDAIEKEQASQLANLSAKERYQQIYKNREEALTQNNRNCDAFKEKTYQLLDTVQKILNEYSMQAADFAKCYGNMIQQALHEEFISILGDTAQLRYVQDNRVQERKAAAATVMGFVQAGNTFKNTGYIPNAITCADICWSFLECQKFLFNVSVDVSLLAFQTVVAGTKGVVKGAINAGLKIIQPVRTFEDLVVETSYLTALVEESFVNGFKDRQMRAIKFQEQRNKDALDLELGLVTHEDLLRRNLNQGKEAIGVSVGHVYNALANVLQNIDRVAYLKGVEKVTEIGTEAWLTGVTLRSASGLVKNGSNTLSDFMNTGGPKNFYDLPLNNSTFGAMVAYESTIADVAAAHGVQVVGGSVAEALDKLSEFAPVLAMSSGPNGGSSGSGGGGSNGNSGGGNNPQNPPHSVLQESKLDAAEHVQLTNKFDGIRTYNGQPVKLPFCHALEGEALSNGTKLGGLHHDFMGYLRQKGFIKNIRMRSHGFYTADVYIGNGKWVQKTFFPEFWTREQVSQCIIDVFDNPLVMDLQGSYMVCESIFAPKIDIRFVFDVLTGEGITFYPVFK